MEELFPLILIGGAVLVYLSSTGGLDLGISNLTSTVSADINDAVDYGRDQAFAMALPANVAQWSTQILSAARQYGVSPWLLAGIMYRESSGGGALNPSGPSGTGDFSKRTPGRNYGNGYVVGASGLPEDGKGWGRGLMQLDWAAQYPWAQQNNWADPQVNLNKGAQVLASALSFFQQPGNPLGITIDAWRMNGLASANVQGWATRYNLQSLGPYMDPRPLTGTDLALAAIAAYNAGTNGVLQAVAAGLPAEAPTADNNYASWIASRVAGWLSNFG